MHPANYLKELTLLAIALRAWLHYLRSPKRIGQPNEPHRRRRTCGFGHPLLDITSRVDDEFLARYDLHRSDILLATEKHEKLYDELFAQPDVAYIPGGSTLNTMRTCRWMLGLTPRTPFVGFVGCIANDQFGTILEDEIQRSCVDALLCRIEDGSAPTGSCACMIVGNERTLVARPGAARKFSVEMFELPHVAEAMQDTDVFYFAGFFLNVVRPSDPEADFPALHLAKYARRNNKVVCVNLSAPYLCSVFEKDWTRLLPYVDYIFGNETEFFSFSEAMQWKHTSLHAVAAACVALPRHPGGVCSGRTVVITCGKKPTVVSTINGTREFKTPQIPKEKITDTNGAGDAFVGGFLSQLVCGADINRCVRAGQYAASEVIQHQGCTFTAGSNFIYPILDFVVDSVVDKLYGRL